MLIQCTKALLDKLEINKGELKSPEGFEQFPNSLIAWHANLVNIDRRKAVILMNNETRYSVVIYRPKPKDFKRIKELIMEAIGTALRMEGVRGDVISNYLDKAGEIEFSKTASRSMVAKLNNAVRNTNVMWDYLDESSLIQRYISIVTSRFIQTSADEEWFYPVEKMLESLGLYSGHHKIVKPDDVREVNLYQLKIQINIEGFDIWRRVLVPSTYSFRHLHNIIQAAFDWQNYHLHQFEVITEGEKDKQIVMDDDPLTLEYLDFEHDEILQERFVALEDIFPEYGEVLYEYDFGDSWEHIIKLEKILKSKSFAPTLLEGEGERPPEDVGGSWGYHEYKRIMADKNDPEHESMKVWAESQKERKRSSETINKCLRHSINGYRYSWF